MIKHLVKHGNSYALIIDRPILDLLDLSEKTPLAVTTDGKCLVISAAATQARERRFTEALHDINQKYGKALKKLSE